MNATVAENAAPDSDLLYLVGAYARNFPREAAAGLDELEAEQVAAALRTLPQESLVASWRHISSGQATAVAPLLDDGTLAMLVQRIDRGDAARLLAPFGKERQETILGGLGEGIRREIDEILTYPPGTAGHLMQTGVIILRSSASVDAAIRLLRQTPDYAPVSILVTDDAGVLAGRVQCKALLLADPAQELSELTVGVPAALSPMDPQTTIAETFEKLHIGELPVIGPDRRPIGLVGNQAMIEAVRADATATAQTMVGGSRDENALSSSIFAVRKRQPWLQINLLTAFLAASVVGVFENTIAQVTALAILLPVVAGQSGNAGAQALAVTMRGLALREIRVADWVRVTRKEVQAGLMNGIGIALTCGVGVLIWSGSPGLMLVIVVSMIISMVAAGTSGALVPIILAKLKQDPAVASSIILTTVTDIVGFFSFLGIATALFSMLV
ncbi:MAG: magnesium transporter [Minwuia sp.]|nr:magnesium transporter [Minwuia sp.]